MRSNIQENPFKKSVMVKAIKREGVKRACRNAVVLGEPYIGQLDWDLVEGKGIAVGLAQLGNPGGLSTHWLMTSPVTSLSITEDGQKAVAQTVNGSTYEVELLPNNYALQPGDLLP